MRLGCVPYTLRVSSIRVTSVLKTLRTAFRCVSVRYMHVPIFSRLLIWALAERFCNVLQASIRHFSLLNVNAAGACGYDFVCDGRRLVRAYLRRRRGAI